MARVVFRFNKDEDLKNIWKACNSGASYGHDFKKSISKNIVELCYNKDYNEVKDKLSDKLKNIHTSKITHEIVKSANSSWKTIEKEYFKRMDKILKRKFPNFTITGYLTSIRKCPYDYNKKKPSFKFNMFSPIPEILHTAGHEIMHFYFHYYYWKYIEKEIGYEKTGDLKEALTVLLNLEFRDLWFVEEQGYPNHDKLREFIDEEWKKKKDIDVLLKKCVKWIKDNGIK